MSRRLIARVIAVVLLAYACAFLLVGLDKEQMATYRSLSHEAMLAKLANYHDANFDESFFGGFVVIAIVILGTDALTALTTLVIDRISPPASDPRVADAMAETGGSHAG
jgi:hypothetical protein